MEEFDISNYLANILAAKEQNSFEPSYEEEFLKAPRLLEASRRKQIELVEQSRAKQEALRKQNEGSAVSMLGLDPEGVVGAPVNAVAGSLNAARRMLTETVAAPFSIGAQAQEELIDPKSMEILKRKSAGGRITPEEGQWISTPTADMYDPLTLSGPSPKQLFEGRFGFEGNRRIATEFRKATDTSSLVNNEAVSKLQDDIINNPENAAALKRLKETNLAYWKAEDLGTLIKGSLEAGGNSPLAVAQLIAENLPQIAVGIVSPAALVASNVGYAQSYYDKWSENYVEREGKEPSLEEKKAAQERSWTLAAAETLGDLATVGATKSLKASLGIGSKAVNATTPEALKKALGVVGNTLPGRLATAAAPAINAAASATGKVLGAAAGEAITEGFQTNTESVLETGKNASIEDIYFGATAGALASGGITSASAGAGLSKDLFGTAQEVKDVLDERKASKTETYKTAVDTGDITPLISNLNPLENKWVDAAEALTKNVEGKTEEDIKETINKIDTQIVSKLETVAENLLMNTDEKATVLEPRIKELKEFLTNNPGSQNAKDMLAQYQAKLAEPINPEKQNNAYKFRAKLLKQLDEVVGLREGLNAQLTEGEAGVLEAARAIIVPVATEGTTATAPDVPTLIARAMKVRGAKSQALADALSNVADLETTSPEDAARLRVLSAEIIASNTAKNSEAVSKDIYYGEGNKKGETPRPGLDFKGVFKYQEAFDTALNRNDKEVANKEFDGLSKFVKHHTAKLEAYKQLKPGTMAVVTETGEWQVKSIPVNSTKQSAIAYAKKNGGFAWFSGAKFETLEKLIGTIEEEVSVMAPVLQKMALQLGKPITTPALKIEGNVSVKQTTEAKQTKEKESKVSKPTGIARRTEQASTTAVKPKEEIKPKEAEAVKPVEEIVIDPELVATATQYRDYLKNPTENFDPDKIPGILDWALNQKSALTAVTKTDYFNESQDAFYNLLLDLEYSAKQMAEAEKLVNESEMAGFVYPKEITKAINETQNELLTDEATSTAKVAEEGASQEAGNDTTGNGPSLDTNSYELDSNQEVKTENKKYTSKQEEIKRLAKMREAIFNFMQCAGI